MDDHMLDRINNEINLCFELIEFDFKEDGGQQYSQNFRGAAALISAYNKIVKIYYTPKYADKYLKKSVAQEYEMFLENKF